MNCHWCKKVISEEQQYINCGIANSPKEFAHYECQREAEMRATNIKVVKNG